MLTERPAVRILRQSEVTQQMTDWAIGIRDNPYGYPLNAEAERTFDGRAIVARVEIHTNPTAENPVPHPHRGITLYAVQPDDGHMVQPHPAYVEGIDVSDYQPHVDWDAMRK